MITPKFKPGDEIVVVNAWTGSDYENGDKGILERVDSSIITKSWWRVIMEGDLQMLVDEEEMEHAAIVDSPLWNALS